MKKFIERLLLFTVSLFFVSIFIDSLLSIKIKEIHEYPGEYEVWNDIYSEELDVDVAVYGSSRAWVHINPNQILDSTKLMCYNFGVDGQNFNIQFLRHKEYIERNRPPKMVILSIDVFSLAKAKDLYGLNQFLPYMLWDWDIYQFTRSYNGFSFLDYVLPLVRYKGKSDLLLKLFSNNEDKVRTNGYLGMEEDWNEDFNIAKNKYENFEIQIDPELVDLLEEFIKELKRQNILLTFVYTPEYIEGQDFVKNREHIFEIYNQLANKYDIPFIDYSNSFLSYNKSLFYNASHLNITGSTMFTQVLISDLKKTFSQINNNQH
ncbi:hypothetical protein [Plebeiibacterium marinum]|uniref:SGNH/GDSL hydrolase family protein n=1 Tax=Plebeiibacterium marinum TaxID=2992111 RepID=A0AAE3MA94_9BACT|nr:hypothetical protein [Plebeiobacterium marinum]MCW3804131.1 hypothetical protein [Plebeiobacterium marinum]